LADEPAGVATPSVQNVRFVRKPGVERKAFPPVREGVRGEKCFTTGERV
jgi:hypothetical protein